MDKAFEKKMQKRLLDMKADILRNLAQENEEFQELVDGDASKDIADIASTDIDKNMLGALGSQELKRLRLIESALGRIETGRYGICLRSGQPIPKERLEAIPYALFRVEYQNEVERRRTS
jgi:RNA polymerase-binding transcription factor DksA